MRPADDLPAISPLNGDNIRSRIRGAVVAPIRVFDAVASTMDEARRWAADGAPHGAAVVAEEQTAGRGRQGRRWESPPGLGLYLSVVFDKAKTPTVTPSLLAGVAVADAVAAACGVRVGIKWPNDLVIDGAKVGGVLVEATPKHYVVGVGVNCYHRAADLPPDTAYGATSLYLAGTATLDRNALAAAVLGELRSWFTAAEAGGAPAILTAWRARAVTLGRRVHVAAADVAGVAEDVNDDGALIVAGEDGRQHVVRVGDVIHDADPSAR